MHNALAVKASFTDSLRRAYRAQTMSIDFNAPGAVGTINEWAALRTNQRVPRILNAIAAGEVAFLVNATWFKGNWRSRFDPALTAPGPFRGVDGVDRQAQMMNRKLNSDTLTRFAWAPEYDGVELPYGNGAYVLSILMPRTLPLGAFIRSLDADAWNAAMARMARVAYDQLVMPKWELAYDRTMNDDLRALGMGIAFTGFADFSGIAYFPLSISRVMQKCYIRVDETGTEAAAVAAVGLRVESLSPSFELNRPFVYAIRERFRGTILFLGVVAKLGG